MGKRIILTTKNTKDTKKEEEDVEPQGRISQRSRDGIQKYAMSTS
jgi:hypothetical protein